MGVLNQPFEVLHAARQDSPQQDRELVADVVLATRAGATGDELMHYLFDCNYQLVLTDTANVCLNFSILKVETALARRSVRGIFHVGEKHFSAKL